MLVAKIVATPTVNPAGSPKYSVGRVGSNNALAAFRPVPAAIEFIDPLTATVSPNLPLAVGISSGTSGQLSVSIRGLCLL